MRRQWPSSHHFVMLFLLFLALCEQITACVDVLFVVDNRTLEISRSRALQVARQLPEDQKIRKWVAISREDRYVPRVLRNNAELQSVLSSVHGDYDRFLEIATGEISRRTATFQPFVILLFSETPVNQTMTNMWRKMSLAPALHIFRIGSSKKRQMLSEDQETDFEKLIQCGRNKTNLFDTESSKFSGGNEIRRAPTSTHRPLTSTRDPFIRRLTFYDASRTLLEDKLAKKMSEERSSKKTSSTTVNSKYTITRTFPKMTTKQMRSTTTARPSTTVRPTSSNKYDAKRLPQRTTSTRTTTRPESTLQWTPLSRKTNRPTTATPKTTAKWSPSRRLPTTTAKPTRSNPFSTPYTPFTRKMSKTITTSAPRSRPTWAPITRKHTTRLFNTDRTTTRTFPATTTQKPSTSTRSRWASFSTTPPKRATTSRNGKTSTTTRTTSAPRSRSTWAPSTRKHPTWLFNTDRTTTQYIPARPQGTTASFSTFPATTTTQKPSTTTRSRWFPSSTTPPRWATSFRTATSFTSVVRKTSTTTTTTAAPRIRTTWAPSTRKHPTWLFDTDRATTRTFPATTTTQKPSTTTRSTSRWSPSFTPPPRWATPSRTAAISRPQSSMWSTSQLTTTTHTPPPTPTIDLPPQKLEKQGTEEFRGMDFQVRSRSMHFAMTEQPPDISTMDIMRLFSTTRPSTTSSKPQVPYSCTADVFFLVDLSQGTGDKSQQYFDIAASAISALPISQEAVRVGLISYSGPGRTQVRVYLDKHSEKDKLIEEMFLMERHGGTTRTADAIRYATKIFEGAAHPARRTVKKVLVVFTDGYSQDNPKEAAREARAKGLQLIAVAVKDPLAPPDEEQLTDIGGNFRNVFISPNGRELYERILGAQCRL